jgi:hypothetical protein
MFAEAADVTCLRQGDILEGIPFPRLSSAEISVLGRMSAEAMQPAVPKLAAVTNVHREDQNWLTAQIPVRLSFCAVITQCCDLELQNGQLRMPAFAVSRLIQIPKNIASDVQRLTSLRTNKDPRVGRDPGYINFFYIPPNPRLENKEWVVDYNQVTCLPGREFPAVLSRKILQMDDSSRVKFKIKLATCLARLTEEERGAGLEDPWIGRQMEFLRGDGEKQ